jgi:hypothetical protein
MKLLSRRIGMNFEKEARKDEQSVLWCRQCLTTAFLPESSGGYWSWAQVLTWFWSWGIAHWIWSLDVTWSQVFLCIEERQGNVLFASRNFFSSSVRVMLPLTMGALFVLLLRKNWSTK